jgi:hypothetical protein
LKELFFLQLRGYIFILLIYFNLLIMNFSSIKFILIMLLVRSWINLIPLSVTSYIRGDYLWFGFKIFIGRTAYNNFILWFHGVGRSFNKFNHLVAAWIMFLLLFLYFLSTFRSVILLLLYLLKCHNLYCRVQRRMSVFNNCIYWLLELLLKIISFILI